MQELQLVTPNLTPGKPIFTGEEGKYRAECKLAQTSEMSAIYASLVACKTSGLVS